MKIGIFANPEGSEQTIISACQELGVDYEVIDLFSPDWLDEFNGKPCDGYIIRPAAYMSIWRNVFLRRMYLLRNHLEGRCVPTLDSILYYESKIIMADLFRLANIPHADTKAFFRFNEAWNYARTAALPLIVKTDGGAGGLGVKRINTRAGLRFQLLRSFFTRYTPRGYHSIYDLRRLIAGLVTPWREFFKTRDYLYKMDTNQGYIVLQDYIDSPWEWRIVVIGKSFFGHQKLPGMNKLHSHSGRVGWIAPPLALLDQVRQWCEKLKLNAMTFDIFEDKQGNYYVNEMQAVMGAYAPSQMYINDVPGRYVYQNGAWVFEEGEFCRHSCNLLRIETLMELLRQRDGYATCTHATDQ